MTPPLRPDRAITRDDRARLIRAGVLTAFSDAAFSSVLSAVFYGSTVARLWQGVASTLLGADAFNGGLPTVLFGLGMHLCVAFSWSTVFLVLVTHSSRLRRILGTPYGVLKVAPVYGPCIWLVMSLIVIPLLLHRPPAITIRWWIQLIGHAPFVGLPIVAAIGAGAPRPSQPPIGDHP